MNKPDALEKGISDIVGVFTDPIIVCPGGWMNDIIPDCGRTAEKVSHSPLRN